MPLEGMQGYLVSSRGVRNTPIAFMGSITGLKFIAGYFQVDQKLKFSRHFCMQSGPNLFQPSEGLEGVYPKELSEPDLVPQGYVDNCDVTQKQGLLPAAYLEGEDFEAPMPPLALAPLPQYDITR